MTPNPNQSTPDEPELTSSQAQAGLDESKRLIEQFCKLVGLGILSLTALGRQPKAHNTEFSAVTDTDSKHPHDKQFSDRPSLNQESQAEQSSALLPIATPQKRPMGIIHNIGYCGAAGIGLLFCELLLQEKITTVSHYGLYRTPIQIFLQHYGLYYDCPDIDLLTIRKKLACYNHHGIQWIIAPVFRLMLVSILKTSQQTSCENFFDQTDFMSKCQWPEALAPHVTDELILTSKSLMNRVNSESITDMKTPLEKLAHHRQYLSQEDLFALCRFLNLKINLHQLCTASTQMRDYRAVVLEQGSKLLEAQCKYFGEIIHVFETIEMHNEMFVFEGEGALGHYDVVNDDLLLIRSKQRLQLTSPIHDVRDQMELFAQIAHVNPDLAVDIISTQTSRANLQSTTPESDHSLNRFSSLNSFDSLNNLNSLHVTPTDFGTGAVNNDVIPKNSTLMRPQAQSMNPLYRPKQPPWRLNLNDIPRAKACRDDEPGTDDEDEITLAFTRIEKPYLTARNAPQPREALQDQSQRPASLPELVPDSITDQYVNKTNHFKNITGYHHDARGDFLGATTAHELTCVPARSVVTPPEDPVTNATVIRPSTTANLPKTASTDSLDTNLSEDEVVEIFFDFSIHGPPN